MPQANSSLESLRALVGLRSNADNPQGDVQQRLQQEQLAAELRRRGIGQADVLQQNMDVEDASALPLRQRAADITSQEQEFEDYQRPGAVAGRQDALQKLLAPVQMRGEYGVRAAEAAAGGRADVAAENNAARAALAGQNNAARSEMLDTREAGLTSRATASAAARQRQQRIQALQTGKAKAARPGGAMDWLTGPSQSKLDQAEIARLMAEGEGAEAAGTVEMIAPDGAILDVPLDQVAAAEAAGARRQ